MRAAGWLPEQQDAGTARLVRTGEIPCEPRAVLARVCRQCHTEPLRNDAPFAMDTYAELDADLDGQPVFAWMRAAVEEGRMPLAPWALTEIDRKDLARLARGRRPARAPRNGLSVISSLDE